MLKIPGVFRYFTNVLYLQRQGQLQSARIPSIRLSVFITITYILVEDGGFRPPLCPPLSPYSSFTILFSPRYLPPPPPHISFFYHHISFLLSSFHPHISPPPPSLDSLPCRQSLLLVLFVLLWLIMNADSNIDVVACRPMIPSLQTNAERGGGGDLIQHLLCPYTW